MARTQVWRVGNKTLFSNKLGTGVVQSFDVAKGIARVSFNRDITTDVGKTGTTTFEYEVKAKIVDGEIQIGRTIKGSSRKIKTTEYRFSGLSRIDNGFMSLMSDLKLSGVSQARIDNMLYTWDNLSESDKIDFFKRYNSSSIVLTYGSDAINENINDVSVYGDDNGYAEVIEEILDEISTYNYLDDV